MRDDDCGNRKNGQRNFLFNIFAMDKAESPMPKKRAEALLEYLKTIFSGSGKSNEPRD